MCAFDVWFCMCCDFVLLVCVFVYVSGYVYAHVSVLLCVFVVGLCVHVLCCVCCAFVVRVCCCLLGVLLFVRFFVLFV